MQAARAFLKSHKRLLGVSDDTIDSLELLTAAPLGRGKAVIFRQRFGDLPAVHDGLVALAVSNGAVRYLSSSLAENRLTGSASLDAAAAIRAAAKAIGVELGALSGQRTENGWTTFDAGGLTDPARARLGVLPTPTNGARTVYEISLYDNSEGDLHGSTSYVDAATGELLVSENTVDFASDNPAWKAFPAYPPLDYSDTDTRELWCWTSPPRCPGARRPSPVRFAGALGRGRGDEHADAAVARQQRALDGEVETNANNAQGVDFSSAPTRDYVYPWTNQWYQAALQPGRRSRRRSGTTSTRRWRTSSRCTTACTTGPTSSASPRQTFNMQKYNFGLGGAENDPEHGQRPGRRRRRRRRPASPSRDNANQITPGRRHRRRSRTCTCGSRSPAAFYAPCVDGDYDMSVIGARVHARDLQPDGRRPEPGLSGDQAGAMGESWWDLAAVGVPERVRARADRRREPVRGRRVRHRRHGGGHPQLRDERKPAELLATSATTSYRAAQVHADGEIWSATNFDIRQAFIARYGAGTRGAAGQLRQRRDGLTASCPGNRRWIQLVFDACLLMASGTVSMLDARDAMLAADMIRFGGANQDLLWNAFARRGIGRGRRATGIGDVEPVPSFDVADADRGDGDVRRAGQAGGRAGAAVRRRLRGPGDAGRGHRSRRRRSARRSGSVAGHATTSWPRAPASVTRGSRSTFNAGQVRDLPVNMPREPRLGRQRGDRERRRRQPRQADRRHRGDELGFVERRRWPASR